MKWNRKAPKLGNDEAMFYYGNSFSHEYSDSLNIAEKMI
jgi:hypothetical protein